MLTTFLIGLKLSIIICLFVLPLNQVAVVIVPTPEELKLRGEKRFKEMGKEVPAEAVNQMLGTTEIGFCTHFLAL